MSSLFKYWREERNYKTSRKTCSKVSFIAASFTSMPDEEVNNTICRFLSEVKKVDGTDYPPKISGHVFFCFR